MIPSKITRRPTLFPESPQQKKNNNLQQVPKASSIPQQFTKMKTNTDQVRHSKNNSLLCENVKTTASISKNEDIKMEIKLKSQIIVDLTKSVQTHEEQNNHNKEVIQSLEKDIVTLNQTIENMCEQMSKQADEFEAQLFEYEKQLKKKENQLMQSKSENAQLLNIIKQGTYNNGKENINIPTTQQEYIKRLKAQIEQQKQQFAKKEEELNRQIQGLNQFLSEIVSTQSDCKTQNRVNSSSRGSKDTIHRKSSLQHEMETFTQKLERIEREKVKCDERMQSMQNTINTLTEKQLMSADNSDNYKEIIKLKQVVQIQKKQIEFQQKTILNQHFEIQNLQTLLYKVDQDSVCEEKQNPTKLELAIHTNAFTASPKEEVYHLNDSQSDIKPRYFFESQQNTFQKYQVITEESTFRN